MSASPTEDMRSGVDVFRDARWKTRWLVAGLGVLLLWHSVSFIDRDWLSQFPLWLVLTITGAAPQVLLLVYPVLTRSPRDRKLFSIPAPARCATEFGIAISVLIGIFVVLLVVNHIVNDMYPGTSLTPDAITRMAASPNHVTVCCLLVFSFTVTPIAEEIFFRGFLYNAFRARMPTGVAALAQALVFGFAHFFGVAHAGLASVAGLILAGVYEWRKTLITPVLVHAGVNFISAVGTVLMMVAYTNSPMMGVIGGPEDTQCVIRQITPNSAAEQAGIQVGDIVMSFNRQPIRDFEHLAQTIQLYRPGDAIPVAINRSGKELEVTIVLRRRGDQ